MDKYVIIVAGGKGLRMGHSLPKQFIPFGDKPLLMHTVQCFYDWDPDIFLILVLPSGQRSYWEMLCRETGFSVPHQIVPGGNTRFESVQNGLAVTGNDGWVAVHDGVRPFVSPEVITACFEEAAVHRAVIPVIPLVDSIRQWVDNGSVPVDRAAFCAVQTPQVFELKLLKTAYKQSWKESFTDDASVVEALGIPVRTVPGNMENIKITSPMDLYVAEALFAEKQGKKK